MKKFLVILGVLVFAVNFGEAHIKQKSKPPPKSRMYIRKEDNSLWSVLKGFVKRIPPQNKKADEFGLEQVKDGHELEHFIEEGILVYFPESSLGFRVDLGKEPPNHQYAHSWVLDFTTDFSKIHQKEIGSVWKGLI